LATVCHPVRHSSVFSALTGTILSCLLSIDLINNHKSTIKEKTGESSVSAHNIPVLARDPGQVPISVPGLNMGPTSEAAGQAPQIL